MGVAADLQATTIVAEKNQGRIQGLEGDDKPAAPSETRQEL
jgi:hypothetical protein